MTRFEYNTVATLLEVGFERWPDWDFPAQGTTPATPHYRLATPHGTFRAYEVRCNGPVYVKLARVLNEAGQVALWGWLDCVSRNSVARKVASPVVEAVG